MLIILVVFVGASLVAISQLSTSTASSTGSTKKPPTSSTTLHSTKTTSPQHVVPKAQVHVQVANGTTVAGLAGNYTHQLLTLGWDTLPAVNGPQVGATIVYYHPGYQWAATSIAGSLGVAQTSAQALGAGAAVTNVTGSTADDVIVVLGPDLG
jgi:hypothetical protein